MTEIFKKTPDLSVRLVGYEVNEGFLHFSLKEVSLKPFLKRQSNHFSIIKKRHVLPSVHVNLFAV